MTSREIVFCVLTLLCCCGLKAADADTAPLTIGNNEVRVVFTPQTYSITLSNPKTDQIYAAGTLTNLTGQAVTSLVSSPQFGSGQRITIRAANGSSGEITVYNNVPFALLQTTLHNTGTASETLNHVPLASFQVLLSKPADSLCTLGTAGLKPAGQNPGSYAFLAVADPVTRSGIVGGWLTDDRGSGVVFSPVEKDVISIDAQIDYGRLLIQPGSSAESEIFAIGGFPDARLGLEQYADSVAKYYQVKLKPQQSGYCTWYAEKYGGACDEIHLAELAKYAAVTLKPFGFNFVQIDDGWQQGVSHNGSKRDFTRSDASYPSGMAANANALKALGFTAGIWFEPFAGTYYDPAYAGHVDWFAKGPDGQPFETNWGGTCLDLTNPGARAHVVDVVRRISHDWGYKLFKMDAFWTGTATRIEYVNSGYVDDHMGEATLSDPAVTNIEDFRNGIKLVKQAGGPDVFYLGCAISQNMRTFGGSFGLVDAIRVGPDTGSGSIGAPCASRLWFLNNRVWYNDPDCVRVQESIPTDQARENATFAAISGDICYDSDWIPDLPADRLDILKRTLLPHGLHARPVDVFENDPARIWTLSDTNQRVRRDIIAVYNWSDSPQTTTVTMAAAGLPVSQHYVGFDYWKNQFVPPFTGSLTSNLPPTSCAVYSIRPVTDYPEIISTSRHVTQGMVDLRSEHWNPNQLALTGISNVIAGDTYELRIVVPTGPNSYQISKVYAAEEQPKNANAPALSTEFTQDGPYIRVRFSGGQTAPVKWSLTFRKAQFSPGE